MRFHIFAAVLCLSLSALSTARADAGKAPAAPPEPPALRFALAAGKLPPLAERLPAEPRRDLPGRDGWKPGRYGGSLTMLAPGGHDARALLQFGYARLVAWDDDLKLVPDILKSFEVEGGRVFTLTLRKGHRWSDGAPFTTEDIRFWWQDVANNAELSPNGLPPALLVDGQPPKVEILDETRVRFTWPAPNPRFLPALAAAAPLFVYRPAHYLKQFHAAYADPAALKKAAEAIGLRSWAELFRRHDRMLQFDDPALPTLQPWVNASVPPTRRFVAERNPYFHRVDAEGRQLPYIDEVILAHTEPNRIPAKVAAGEADLQARGLAFRDGETLKQAEKDGRIRLRLWTNGRGGQLALYPNLNAAAPGWRAVLRDLRFRRALSLGIDRKELNQVLYHGSALPGADTLLPGSPLFKTADRAAWASYDPKQANDLLDALGMTWKDDDGIRHLPDGRRAELIVESAISDPAGDEMLTLVKAQWAKIGIALVAQRRTPETLRERIAAGATVMSLAPGLADGLATPQTSPAALAPTGRRPNAWPLWSLHYQSGGDAGEAPGLPAARRLLALYQNWTLATDDTKRTEVWQQMLEINADRVFTIGLVGAVPQPVAANPRLRNLPETAVYMGDPGSGFGRTRTDTLWFAEK